MVPALRLPLGAALALLGLWMLTLMFCHGWRQMLVSLAFWAVVALALGALTRRDHNALRRKRLALTTKARCRRIHLWRGATVSSLTRTQRNETRGIPNAR